MPTQKGFGFWSIRIMVLPFLLFFAAKAADGQGPNQFPGFADHHTVALYLFDEPQYLNMTLTDAGMNRYDLRLLDGGMMVAGRFGNALRLSSTAGPAVELPFRSRTYDDTPLIVPASRPVADPEKLYPVLSGDEWTVEFWLKMGSMPDRSATLLEVGRGDFITFKCALAPEVRGFNLTGGDGPSRFCPTDSSSLGDEQWHHIAFVRSDDEIRHYLDGREQGASRRAAMPQPPESDPGLIGTFFTSDLAQPLKIRAAGNIDFYWGETRDMSWRERWRGRIRHPDGGTVEIFSQGINDYGGGVDPLNAGGIELSRQAAGDVKVVIDGKTIIGDLNSESPSYGKFTFKANQAYPFQLDFLQDSTTSRLRLYWRRNGGDWETVPASAFSHTRDDIDAARNEAVEVFETRPYVSLGSGRFYQAPAGALLDEMRISDVARYTGNFEPTTFSRNHGLKPPQPAEPTGPPLLFAGEPGPEPVQLGSRKHVFIDDIMIESRANAWLKVNPPTRKEVTDMRNGEPWEHPSAAMFADCCIYDDNGEVRFVYLNNAMWQMPESTHTVCLAVSRDGLHFEKPNLGVHEWEGSRDNNIILKAPVQGRAFKDPNPNVPPEERYKFSTFHMHRGIYLYVSPDGINWRRNETLMLPFDGGGGAEMFWDDQRGEYFCFMRHEGWAIFRPHYGRSAAMAVSNDPLRVWPFTRIPTPGRVGKAWALPSFTRELPVPFQPTGDWQTIPGHFYKTDQVYRTRAQKYEWAPDTYVAFVWRLNGVRPNDVRESELATSRDGVHWKFYGGDPYYMDADWTIQGEKVRENLAVHGMIRRGDEIWQYANVKCSTHVYDSDFDRLYRYTQRLDGFVALESEDLSSWAITMPFVFEGDRLELNVDASEGGMRVGILDGEGNAIPGYLVNECDPIMDDSVRKVVSWQGRSDVSDLAGKPVKLRIEMKNTRLFAFQFADD